VLAGVSVLVFSLIHLVPGDPVRLALGTRFSQESYDALRERNGLDLPLVEQYVPPPPTDLPAGCVFWPRCPDVNPVLQPAGAPDQQAACHLHGVVGTPQGVPAARP
jgi:hypothetical protein